MGNRIANSEKQQCSLDECAARIDCQRGRMETAIAITQRRKHQNETQGLFWWWCLWILVLTSLFCLEQILELEASHGNSDAVGELRKEINYLRTHCENMESEVKQKDCEIDLLKKRMDDQFQMHGLSNQKVDDKIKVINYHWNNELCFVYVSGLIVPLSIRWFPTRFC